MHLSTSLAFSSLLSRIQWSRSSSRFLFLSMLSLSLTSKFKLDSRNFVKCHDSSRTEKMQFALFFRWLSDIDTRKLFSLFFRRLCLRSSETFTSNHFTNYSKYCTKIDLNYRQALLCEKFVMYMNFIDWMCTNSKKKKKQTYNMYWRRLCLYFSLFAEQEISNNVMKQMRRVWTLLFNFFSILLTRNLIYQYSSSNRRQCQRSTQIKRYHKCRRSRHSSSTTLTVHDTYVFRSSTVARELCFARVLIHEYSISYFDFFKLNHYRIETK